MITNIWNKKHGRSAEGSLAANLFACVRGKTLGHSNTAAKASCEPTEYLTDSSIAYFLNVVNPYFNISNSVASSITVTPSSLALVSLEPAASPATT